MHYFLSILALMAIASSCVTALGINCHGSSNCGIFYLVDNPPQTVAATLRQEIAAHVSDNRLYQNGTHIVCIDGRVGTALKTKVTGSVCAFLQSTGGLPGSEIKKLAQRIVGHKCEVCGSVPAFYDSGDNDVDSHGELTFNYVQRDISDDPVCSSIHSKCYYDP